MFVEEESKVPEHPPPGPEPASCHHPTTSATRMTLSQQTWKLLENSETLENPLVETY